MSAKKQTEAGKPRKAAAADEPRRAAAGGEKPGGSLLRGEEAQGSLLRGKVFTREVEIINKLGIHARPAAMFVKLANRFACDIFVEKDGDKINGKSIMGLLMLAAGPGSRLKLYAEGRDAHQALAELEDLIKRKFDEE